MPLAKLSAERDAECARKLGLEIAPNALRIVGRHNAHDYLLQRMYPVPDRQEIRCILDFGAGLGRMANLAFGAPDSKVESMITVDGIHPRT